MRNAFFSSMSPPQLYNFAGNNTEVQVPNLDVSMQVDSIITNVRRSGFTMESRVFKEDNNQHRDGGFAVSCQSLFNYHQDFQSIITSCNNIPQHSLSLTRKRSFSQLDVDFESLQNTKMHVTEVNDLLPQEGISDDLACDKAASNLSKTIKKKKIKANSSCEEQSHHQVEETSAEIQNHRVPVRRSHKLSDKITALQKLVSPYGKTDTASVLQEASVYIKVLQGQIQNLFQMLTSSYESVTPLHSHVNEMGAEHLELKNRGLCLVPISFTHQVTKEGPVDPHPTSTKNQMNQNF